MKELAIGGGTGEGQNWRRLTPQRAAKPGIAKILGRTGEERVRREGLGQLSREERPVVGKAANEIEQRLEEAMHVCEESIRQTEMEAALSAEGVDVTLPGRGRMWCIHPSNAPCARLVRFSARWVFRSTMRQRWRQTRRTSPCSTCPTATRPGICGIPSTPPRQASFCAPTPAPAIIHAMREYCPQPIRVILPGKCYRHEDGAARSEMMFHQVEGLVVGRNITFSDFKGTLVNFVNQMFGEGRSLRFRKSDSPFTKPSVVVDVDCVLCGEWLPGLQIHGLARNSGRGGMVNRLALTKWRV